MTTLASVSVRRRLSAVLLLLFLIAAVPAVAQIDFPGGGSSLQDFEGEFVVLNAVFSISSA